MYWMLDLISNAPACFQKCYIIPLYIMCELKNIDMILVHGEICMK